MMMGPPIQLLAFALLVVMALEAAGVAGGAGGGSRVDAGRWASAPHLQVPTASAQCLLMRLRGGMVRKVEAGAPQEGTIEAQLDNVLSRRDRKFRRASRESKPKWFGAEPLPKSVMRKMREKKMQKAPDHEENEIKFNQEEFNDFVTGFHKRKLRRKKLAQKLVEEQNRHKVKKRRKELNEQKKQAQFREQQELEAMRARADLLDIDDPLARTTVMEEEPSVAENEYQHLTGSTTSVVIEKMDFDRGMARDELLSTLPVLPSNMAMGAKR